MTVEFETTNHGAIQSDSLQSWLSTSLSPERQAIMVSYFQWVCGRLVVASMFVAIVAVGGTRLVTPQHAVAGQADTAAWMASEATRLVNAQYKPDSVVITQSDVGNSIVRGTWIRRAGSQKWDFMVKFHVEGTGTNRHLVAETPVLTHKY